MENQNSPQNQGKYDFKTIKVRPDIFEKLVKLKGKMQLEKGELLSFNKLLKSMLEEMEKK